MIGKVVLILFGIVLISVGIGLANSDSTSLLREQLFILPIDEANENEDLQVQENDDPIASFAAWVNQGRR